MAWASRVDKDAQRTIGRLDREVARKVVAKLREVARLDDQRNMGKGLTGNLSGLCRYRAGDDRIVCSTYGHLKAPEDCRCTTILPHRLGSSPVELHPIRYGRPDERPMMTSEASDNNPTSY